MILGFLGKGGSGKSTLATQMTRYLHAHGSTVLAIDADHNMDLAYNLGVRTEMPALGDAYNHLSEHVGLAEDAHWSDAFFSEPSKRFSLSSEDEFIKKYAVKIDNHLYAMVAGPQNDAVLYGQSCSHTLSAPLKAYLPLLKLKESEYVVVDEKASVDAVTTGIPTGFDLAVVVMEPREHSVRVAKQIVEMLQWYNVPSILALNKMQTPEDQKMLTHAFGREPDIIIPSLTDPLQPTSEEVFETIVRRARTVSVANQSRFERTRDRLARNRTFTAELGAHS